MCEAYVREKGLAVDPQFFWDFFEASDPKWHDSNGKAVKSWKQKMLTWNRMQLERGIKHTCSRAWCNNRGVYIKGTDRDGRPLYYCIDHKPAPPPIPKAMQPMVGKLADKWTAKPKAKPEPVYKQRKRLLIKEKRE